jgi:hypothetical protein
LVDKQIPGVTSTRIWFDLFKWLDVYL